MTVLGDILVTAARNEIYRLRRPVDSTSERSTYDDTGTHRQLRTGSGDAAEDLDSGCLISHASAASEVVLGSSLPALTGPTAEDLHDNPSKMSTVLSSERSFRTAL